MAQILEDTRQQAGKHENKARWFARHGVEVERRKLDFGDYMDASGSSNVAVDTKRSIDEVAMDCGRDHARFVREMERAKAAGCRLVVLIEVGHPYKRVSDINGWVSGACKRCDLYRIHVAYYARAVFCRAVDPEPEIRCRCVIPGVPAVQFLPGVYVQYIAYFHDIT